MTRYSTGRAAVALLLVALSTGVMVGSNLQAVNSQSATTLTTILTTTITYYSELLEIPGTNGNPGTDPPCGWTFLLFQATKGQHISGSLESKGPPISFYVMSDSVRKSWRVDGRPVVSGTPDSVSPCHGAPGGSLITRDGITSYTISLNFPTDGTYWLWFININRSKTSFDVNFVLVGSPTVVTSTTVLRQSTTSIVTPTVSPTTIAPSVGLMPFGNLGVAAVGATVAVIASALVLARRRKTAPPSPTLKQETAAVQVSRKGVTPSQPVISTGYSDLDGALEGGVPEGFAVVVVSPSYDERDLLLRKIIESGLSSGRPAFYISNDMGRTQDLVRRYESGFYAFSSQADKIPGHLTNLFKIPGIENLSDANISLSLAIRDTYSKEKSGNAILIIDILSDVLLRHKSITTRRWLSDFVSKRKAEGFTIIATLNPLTTTKEETQAVIDSFDGVIEIYERTLTERARRFLVVKKMYGRRYSENELLLDKDKLF